jgi:omega-hydroxy-beta-dihydromenaquinone-9 sulfotransferase
MSSPRIRAYVSQLYRGWFHARGTHGRLTPKRIGVLLTFTILYPLIEILNWVGFALDRLLFPNWRQARLEAPVFIIGNPRSGTTFLHRLLMRDSDTFYAMQTWETLLAPSVTQRVLLRGLARCDRALGRPMARLLTSIERSVQRGIPMHGIGLREPEEDEGLLVHLWAGLMPWGFFPDDELPAAARFDDDLPIEEQDRILSFYRDCLLRHAHARTRGHHYLAKSPAFSGKVAALLRHIPDARFIVLVRSPLQQVPSEMSLRAFIWHRFSDPLEPYPLKEQVLEKIAYWYEHPPEILANSPDDRHLFLTYDELTADPEAAVRRIYERFALDLSPSYAEILAREAAKARQYRSRHRYTIEAVGLTRQEIVERYHDVFEAYGFDSGGPGEVEEEDHAAAARRRRRPSRARRPRRGRDRPRPADPS